MIDKSLGTKRLCPGCNAKFYDLSRSPAVCPHCDHEFVPKPVLPSKQDQMEASQAQQEAPLPSPALDTSDDVVDDVAAQDDVADVALDDVADVADVADAADDAVFIEEEGDTPVEDIIPTGVEKDDEES